MPCYPLVDSKGRRTGTICMAPERIRLDRGIWMEFHPYFGPSFYPTKDSDDPIPDWWEKPRINAAWEKWHQENPKP